MKIVQSFLLLTLGLPLCVRGAVVLSVSPTNQNRLTGTPVSVDVSVSGLGVSSGPSIGTYDLTISLDSAILSYSSVVFGSGLDVLGLGSLQSIAYGVGTVNILEVSLDAIADLNSFQPSAFSLFTLMFTAIGTGTTSITISLNALGDADGNSLAATLQNGSVTVESVTNVVPEVSTFGLVGFMGIALLLGARLRTRAPR